MHRKFSDWIEKLFNIKFLTIYNKIITFPAILKQFYPFESNKTLFTRQTNSLLFQGTSDASRVLKEMIPNPIFYPHPQLNFPFPSHPTKLETKLFACPRFDAS